MKQGAIVLSRDLLETRLWRDAGFWRLWTWCLLAAGRRARIETEGGVPARLAAGELRATLPQVGRATGLTKEEVRRCLSFGKELGRLAIRVTPWGVRIKIVDWQEHRLRRPEGLGSEGGR